MFSAVTVVIEADADNPEVTLPGSWITPGSNGRYLLWPGKYKVLIDAPGYHVLDTEIEVASGDRKLFSFKLEELPGRISVAPVPDTAGEVWIDGVRAGEIPRPNHCCWTKVNMNCG